MIKCPKCGSGATRVLNSRHRDEIKRRRYECKECGYRFNTTEFYVTDEEDKALRHG